MGRPAIDIPSGTRRGMLVVTGRAGSNAQKSAMFYVRCDCGVERTMRGAEFRIRGNSCGCQKGKSIHGFTTANTTTPTYNSWATAKQRCTNHNRRGSKDYIGRGITMCDRWLRSFANFLADMGPRPDGTSLDRRDNDLGYSIENCRWATPKEQARNTSRTLNDCAIALVRHMSRRGARRVDVAHAFGVKESSIRRHVKLGAP